MALYGSLKTMPLADLLQWMKSTYQTGTLYIHAHNEEYSIYLEQGFIQKFAARELSQELGRHLISHGFLNHEQMESAYRMMETNKKSLYDNIINSQLISEEVLSDYLKEASLEMMYDLFLIPDGEFTYGQSNETTSALGNDESLWVSDDLWIPLTMNIENMILEGMKRMDEWTRVKEVFPHVNITVTHNPELSPEHLSSRENKIYEAIVSGNSPSKICFDLRLSHFTILRILHNFHQKKWVQVSATEELPAGSVSRKTDDIGFLLEQANTLSAMQQYEEAITLYQVILKINPEAEKARLGLNNAMEDQIEEFYQNYSPLKVPKLTIDKEQIGPYNLSQEEIFLVSQIDGLNDIGKLVMYSPMGERDTLKTIKKLVHIGVVEIN